MVYAYKGGASETYYILSSTLIAPYAKVGAFHKGVFQIRLELFVSATASPNS